MRRLNKGIFIDRASKIHGNKYDYSRVVYVNNSTKVDIICPIHGIFKQTPANHLNGKGCKKCYNNRIKKAIYKNYYNDYSGVIWDKSKGKMIPSYIAWRAMIIRCEDKTYQSKYPTYIGCSVCKEWHLFSVFKAWFDDNYISGWHLDKDLLKKDNKEYSPNTCCFLPNEINSCLTKNNKNRGKFPIGVYKHKQGYFVSTYHRKYLGLSTDVYEMFNRYKIEKENFLKTLADKYKSQLHPRAYNALYNYQVEIND